MRPFIAAVRKQAVDTPSGRDRHVDLLRAFAICMVVLGHWLIISVSYVDGDLSGRNALDVLSWSHPVTWLFQVMPIFFFVGGYANAASLRSHRRSGGDGSSWILARTGRLLPPVTALIVVAPVAAIVAAVVVDVPEDLVGTLTWLASMPLWFLLAYLAMVALTPWMFTLHQRVGLVVPVVLVVVVGINDVLRLVLDVPYVGESSYLFGWLAVHQLGFCWRDGLLSVKRGPALVWTVGGLAALVILTVAGPYEVRVVGVNTDPPTLALLALAATQVGLVLVLRPVSNRWLARSRPWAAVVAVNAVILTVFVWHMTAALAAAAIVYPTGLMAQPAADSPEWLLWRLPWVGCAGVVLVVLVAAFARIETRRRDVHPLPRTAASRNILAGLGLGAVLGGLLGIALNGSDYDGPGGLPPAAVLTYLAGAVLLWCVRRQAQSRSVDHTPR